MKTKISVATSIILLAVFFGASDMSAYVLYPFFWPTNSALYDAHTLDSAWKSAVSYGAGRWENVSSFDWRSDSGSVNDVYLDYIDGKNGTLASTTMWYYGNWLTKFIIRFDESERWYTGSGSPGSSRLDARSEAAHEFGHALGINHTQSGNCSGSESKRPTMCAYYRYGKTWARSLEADDEDAVVSRYNALMAVPQTGHVFSPVASSGGVVVDFSYAEMSLRERVESADAVVRGTVAGISPTKWNQDSELYWEETVVDEIGETTLTALPYYEVEIVVSDIPLTFRKMGKTVVLTILGESPLGDTTEHAGISFGDDVVLFARDTELVWRGGTRRRVLMPVGAPDASIFSRGTDGLYRELGAENGAGVSLESLEHDVLFLRSVEE